MSFIVLLVSCTNDSDTTQVEASDTLTTTEIIEEEPQRFISDTLALEEENASFRNIRVIRSAPHEYLVTGEARIFEATVSWSLEDGHNYLDSGFATAEKGAPDWGRFSIPINRVDDPNTALLLILFEHSAKDGSHRNELPIRLDQP